MRDRWSAQLAACLLVVHLCGCNVLLFPLTVLKGVLGMLVGLLKYAGPAAGALVQVGPEVSPTLPDGVQQVEQQLVQMYRAPEETACEALDPTALAERAKARGARGVTLVDLRDLTEEEARACLRRLAERGEVLLLDSAPLSGPDAEARLAAALKAAAVKAVAVARVDRPAQQE